MKLFVFLVLVAVTAAQMVPQEEAADLQAAETKMHPHKMMMHQQKMMAHHQPYPYAAAAYAHPAAAYAHPAAAYGYPAAPYAFGHAGHAQLKALHHAKIHGHKFG